MTCDTCGRTIVINDRSNHYYEVATHHSRWGNESIDSYRYLDFCSYECLLENMNDYFKMALIQIVTKFNLYMEISSQT